MSSAQLEHVVRAPRFPNFPIVGFIFVNGSTECHLFQVTLTIDGHSKSAENFAAKYLKIFKDDGIKKFLFCYLERVFQIGILNF